MVIGSDRKEIVSGFNGNDLFFVMAIEPLIYSIGNR